MHRGPSPQAGAERPAPVSASLAPCPLSPAPLRLGLGWPSLHRAPFETGAAGRGEVPRAAWDPELARLSQVCSGSGEGVSGLAAFRNQRERGSFHFRGP